jgi:lysophospholipase L1-like esterase
MAIVGYQIRVDGTDLYDFGNVLSYDITGLSSGQHFFERRSLNDEGVYSAWSNRVYADIESLAAPVRIDSGRTSGGTVATWLQDTMSVGGTAGSSSVVGADTTGVTDPAPAVVYETMRTCTNDPNVEIYHITGLVPNKPHKIRYHTAYIAGGYRNVGHEYPLPTFRHALFDHVYENADANKARIYEGSLLSDVDGEIGLSFSGYGFANAFCNGLEIIEVPEIELSDLSTTSVQTGNAYSEQLTVPDAVGSVTFEIRRGDGALPKGMNLSGTGLLSGTPQVYRPSQIITAGDSRTAGTGTTNQNQTRWPVQLGLLLGDKFTITNLAAGGAQLAGMATAYTTYAVPARDPAMAKDIYILMGGRNDIDAGRSATDIYNDIAAQCAQAQSDGFLVIVSTIGFDGTFDGTKEGKRNTVNGNIRTNYATFADAMFDTDDYDEITLPGPDGSGVDYFYFAFDAIHYAAPGFGIIANGMKNLVHSLAPNGAAYSPTSDATFDFTVTAIDENGSIDQKDYTLTVTP